SLNQLTRGEFNGWLREGRFDSQTFDGVRHFVGTSVSNLFWRHPELEARRRVPLDRPAYLAALLAEARKVKAAATEQNRSDVLRQLYEVTMTVTVDRDAVRAGEIIRAWLPVPRRTSVQEGLQILETSSPVKAVADESSPIRSVYMEQPALAGAQTEFRIRYQFVTRAVRFDLDPSKVRSINPNDPALKPFLSEAPHVVFSGKIKYLAKQITGAETNPLRQARAFYDWISTNVLYSFAREYSTLGNISDDCVTNRWGDCGQQALLYITLCRSQGIPARWQSGWYLFPGHKNIHDWTEIFIAPYGWVPVDPNFGGFAMRYGTTLSQAEREELRDFYFAGLDHYRLIANSDHSQTLSPPKKFWRSDDVDFQRGEVEWRGGNLYFDQTDYSLDMQVLPVAQ
ncbi:MAG: transglutaminase domain-containing protein, partial [Opitutaceae bacterium]|nr:transglutaminase domain-containing protein [Verrucomicrobiales bacterium]